MKLALIPLIPALFSFNVDAGDTWLNVHGVSHHVQASSWFDDAGVEHEFNEVNPGLGLTHEWTERLEIRAGFFKNSFNKTSVYAGGGWHTSYDRLLSFSMQAGIMTGYQDTPTGGDSVLLGYVLPTVGLNFERVRVELGYIPKVSSNKDDNDIITLSFAIKI